MGDVVEASSGHFMTGVMPNRVDKQRMPVSRRNLQVLSL